MSRRDFTLPEGTTLRDYQYDAVTEMKYLRHNQPDKWHLFASPTGTGKSIIELAYLSAEPDSIMITPRLEIIAGMMDKMGEDLTGVNDMKLVELAWKRYGIVTPIRLRNMLARGELDFMPSSMLIDECHHDTADTYQDITMYLNGCPKVGLTATPYRGTPKQTREFHRQWNDTINQILSLSDAVNRGYYQIPDVEIWPLLDDDTIDVSAGEFRVSTCEGKLHNSYAVLASNCQRMYSQSQRLWDKPTIFALPGSKSCVALQAMFGSERIPTNVVTQATSRLDRIKAFEDCINCRAALIQINVVSEGVDLPIRRVIDCSPTMSPVRWFQQVGRIRPMNVLGPDAFSVPEYICCCRNLERHCYLWEGLLPNSKIAEAQSAFTDDCGVPLFSKRSGTRVVGLEGLGKFTTTPVHLLNGTIGFMYNLVNVEGNKRTEYIAFIHPNNPDPIYGVKESASDGVEMKWGKWKLTESLPDVKGCVSAKVYPLTEKQTNRWYQSAEGFGLNPHREVNTREFQVLPFLMNTGLSFK